MKVLLLLALTLFATVSTIATVVVASDISVPKLFSTAKTIVNFTGFRDIQPTGGDPVDNPAAPS